MKNVVVHSKLTGSEFFQIDFFLLLFKPTVPPPNQTKSSDHFPDLWSGLLLITCYPNANTKFFPTTCTVQASNQTSVIGCATTVEYSIPTSLLLNVTKQGMDVKVTKCSTKVVEEIELEEVQDNEKAEKILGWTSFMNGP